MEQTFSSGLYRALAGNRWRRIDEPDMAVAPRWTRAERLVNELREHRGEEPLGRAEAGAKAK